MEAKTHTRLRSQCDSAWCFSVSLSHTHAHTLSPRTTAENPLRGLGAVGAASVSVVVAASATTRRHARAPPTQPLLLSSLSAADAAATRGVPL